MTNGVSLCLCTNLCISWVFLGISGHVEYIWVYIWVYVGKFENKCVCTPEEFTPSNKKIYTDISVTNDNWTCPNPSHWTIINIILKVSANRSFFPTHSFYFQRLSFIIQFTIIVLTMKYLFNLYFQMGPLVVLYPSFIPIYG